MYILLCSLTVSIKYLLASYHFNLIDAEVQATISKTVHIDQVQTKNNNPLVTKANSVKGT